MGILRILVFYSGASLAWPGTAGAATASCIPATITVAPPPVQLRTTQDLFCDGIIIDPNQFRGGILNVDGDGRIDPSLLGKGAWIDPGLKSHAAAISVTGQAGSSFTFRVPPTRLFLERGGTTPPVECTPVITVSQGTAVHGQVPAVVHVGGEFILLPSVQAGFWSGCFTVIADSP